MNKDKERYFTVSDASGKITEYEILFTFERDDVKKSYMVFTDGAKDDTGRIATYAATYDKLGDELKLGNIETDEEWDLIENLLSQIEEKTE